MVWQTPSKRATVKVSALNSALNGPNTFNRPRVFARIEQTMEMDNKVAHVRVVHGLLRLGLPYCVRGCIIRKHADGFDLFEILEGRMITIDQFAADDEME